MKKRIIPAIVAIILIALVILVSLSTGIMEKYSYSTKWADLNEHFSLKSDDEVAIILQDELIGDKALVFDGIYYLDYDLIKSFFNKRFYYNENEKALFYTTPTDIIRAELESTQYTVGQEVFNEEYQIIRMEDEITYIAIEYVKKFTNLSYKVYHAPNRMQLNYQWGAVKIADIEKDTAVRKLGGVKSPILKEVLVGDSVTVLEEMNNWSKVETDDGIIGFVENKRLTNERDEQQAGVTEYVEPEYTNISKDYKINMVWHQVMSAAANSTLSEALEGTKGINTISPTWFSLNDNEGNIANIATIEYVNEAHQRGMEVWGLVDNFTYPEVSTFEVLSYSHKRANLINHLIAAAKEFQLDGINIDFEQVSVDTGEHFVQFIRELSIQCRANNIVLSVDNYVPEAYSSHYNRKEQGIVADYVIIMGYDEHFGGSPESGSVASLEFVKKGIEKTVEEVDPHKVINALPFYTRIWKEIPKTEAEIAEETPGTEFFSNNVSSEAVGIATAEKFVRDNQIELAWDEEVAQNYGQVQKDDSTYKVWMEDDRSIDAKMQLMKEFDLAGAAGWKLGLEKKSFWDVIAKYMD